MGSKLMFNLFRTIYRRKAKSLVTFVEGKGLEYSKVGLDWTVKYFEDVLVICINHFHTYSSAVLMELKSHLQIL